MKKSADLPFSLHYLSDKFVLTHDLSFHFENLKFKKSDLIPFNKKRLGLASSGLLGVIDKYGCAKNNKHYIVKASPSHFNEMADIEFLTNQIFDLFEINMATYGIGDLGKKRIFISENFMDDYLVPATPKHFSSFFHECEGYNVQNIIKLLNEKISSNKEEAVREFLKITLIDSFTGNYDRHPGNLMLIYINGQYELSPAYDNISMIALRYKDELADLNYGGRISTEKSVRPMFSDYLIELENLGFKSFLIEESQRYFERENEVRNLIKKSNLKKDTKKVLLNLVQENLKDLRECYAKIKSMV